MTSSKLQSRSSVPHTHSPDGELAVILCAESWQLNGRKVQCDALLNKSNIVVGDTVPQLLKPRFLEQRPKRYAKCYHNKRRWPVKNTF